MIAKLLTVKGNYLIQAAECLFFRLPKITLWDHGAKCVDDAGAGFCLLVRITFIKWMVLFTIPIRTIVIVKNLMETENWEALTTGRNAQFFRRKDKTRIKVPQNGDDCLAEIFPSTKGGHYREYVCQECLPLNTKEWYSSDNTNQNKYVFFNEDILKGTVKTSVPVEPHRLYCSLRI